LAKWFFFLALIKIVKYRKYQSKEHNLFKGLRKDGVKSTVI